MTQPWYPFLWSDYTGKTFDLTQGQHGSYFLLLRHIYTTGTPVPGKQCYSIARAVLEAECSNVDFVLARYFKKDGDNWRNLRAEEVMQEADEAHQRKVEAGRKGGKKKSSNARAMPYQPQPLSLSKEESKKLSKKESCTALKEAACEIIDFQRVHEYGSSVSMRLATHQSMHEIKKWLEAGCSIDDDIIPVLERSRGKDIGSWTYFSNAIMDSQAQRLTPLPKGNGHAAGNHGTSKTTDSLAALYGARNRVRAKRENRNGESGGDNPAIEILPPVT